jgi:hypothetical protein
VERRGQSTTNLRLKAGDCTKSELLRHLTSHLVFLHAIGVTRHEFAVHFVVLPDTDILVAVRGSHDPPSVHFAVEI